MSATSLTISIASFNAERFWRDENMSALPSFRDSQANTIIEAMDEMQFVFCENKNDLSLTRFPMNPAHKDYLGDLGFNFLNNACPLDSSAVISPDIGTNTCSLICENIKTIEELRVQGLEYRELAPFSIVPGLEKLRSAITAETCFPSIDIVKKVNSKTYSTQVTAKLYIAKGGMIIYTADELLLHGAQMFSRTPLVIKDPFGVSGSGNISVNREITLRSIAKHLQSQERQGKHTELIIEPLLAKETDFSCQAYLDRDGSFKIISVQIMDNEGFRFSGIREADEAFMNVLNASHYFLHIEQVAGELFIEGYYGPLCFDSMVLKTGEVVPIVEINARKSMGLINHMLYKRITSHDRRLKHKLMTLMVTMSQPVPFEVLIDHLRAEGILYRQNSPIGVLPVSANTFDINANFVAEGPVKGRLYYALIYKDFSDFQKIYAQVQKVCEGLSIKIL
jgi:hypothetical protein